MNTIRKALLAAVAAGVAAVTQAISSGGLDSVNWAVVLGAAVVAGLAVWGIPNAPKAP